MLKYSVIREKALEIMSRPEFKEGIRFNMLVKIIVIETKENVNTINGSIWNMPNEMSDKVARPQRGLFILNKNMSNFEQLEQESSKKYSDEFKEDDVYSPAKDFLLSRGECSHAVVIGGNILGKKWGTPDILGSIRVSSDAVYKPPLEIVAVEVKGNNYSPVEALGQAMAYKLFAHRTWLVLPETDDIDRIEGIAMSANIGLVVFNFKNNQFDFETRNRPVIGSPDADEVNKILFLLKDKDKGKYNKLIKNEMD
jgi:hypothetical protein